MIEINNKRKKQIYHCLNMVYINYLSTHCTFIYLVLKILKLLPTNDKPGERFRKVNLFLRVAEYKCLAIEKRTYFSTTKPLRKLQLF